MASITLPNPKIYCARCVATSYHHLFIKYFYVTFDICSHCLVFVCHLSLLWRPTIFNIFLRNNVN